MAQQQNDSKRKLRQFYCRTRRCFLKGCERRFYPSHPRCRYCSMECRVQARRWRSIKAQQRYRRSIKGKDRRQGQSRRYRARVKARQQGLGSLNSLCNESEGNPKEKNQGDLCARSGCYERVHVTRRSPLQKYCSTLCYQAVKRVLQRERRWLIRVVGRFF